MTKHPTYVLVKLLDPVGPEDAQNVARHVVSDVAFSDVEWAQPVTYDGIAGLNPTSVRFAETGERVSLL